MIHIFITFVKIIYFGYNSFGDYMKTIEKKIHEFEIQKSRFICYIDNIYSEDDVKKVLDNIKNKYPDATHYCYAYIINNIKRFQDDGEPGGTAGMPILHVLESHELKNVIAIVVRYFGGIKLGAGGLVRAYTNSVSECIKEASIVEVEECQLVEIKFDYQNIKQIDYYLKKYTVIKREFDEKVIYEVAINKDLIQEFLNNISNVIDEYNIMDKIMYIKNQDNS